MEDDDRVEVYPEYHNLGDSTLYTVDLRRAVLVLPNTARVFIKAAAAAKDGSVAQFGTREDAERFREYLFSHLRSAKADELANFQLPADGINYRVGFQVPGHVASYDWTGQFQDGIDVKVE